LRLSKASRQPDKPKLSGQEKAGVTAFLRML
jgi:hypothetical protein